MDYTRLQQPDSKQCIVDSLSSSHLCLPAINPGAYRMVFLKAAANPDLIVLKRS
jgi:hypothetical protein